jgi:hypothetical protein
MFIWVLRDYPLNPRFQGGSIHGVLPHLRLIEGLNQKGLFDYAGRPKPAVGAVARRFGRCPAREAQPRLPRAIRRRSIVSS